jgi:mannose-1-phosphate guanylyltransferase
MIKQPSATPVFILAGGAGERLSPLTASKPKPPVTVTASFLARLRRNAARFLCSPL